MSQIAGRSDYLGYAKEGVAAIVGGALANLASVFVMKKTGFLGKSDETK